VTAEIAVMNEEAIALAADSAVTGPAKIFTSANKIFALSKYHPVALMVFDNAQFLHVPWDTIVKQYRRELGDKSFPTLSEHADHFLKFFNRAREPFPPEAQKSAVETLTYSLFSAILSDALVDVEISIENGTEPTKREVIDTIENTIALHHARWKRASARKGLPKTYRETVRKKYRTVVANAIKAVFERVELSPQAKRQLAQLIPEVAVKDDLFLRAPTHSGIVIAGFGSKDVFPRLRQFHFEAIIANRLKFTEDAPIDVGIQPGERAFIVPFAQAEQVQTFMEGIDPRILQHIHRWWHGRLDEFVIEIADHLNLSDEKRAEFLAAFDDRCADIVHGEFEKDLRQFSHMNNIGPIINIVGMLPKDELAEMAESLVNLTSFKRRVTPEAETVGGPIDVAVISRGDGFIWIKRKHYFSRDLNPHFLANYYRGDGDGKTK
jgi:hypothetical protein